MKLHPPFIITARLMAGVQIADGTISIGYSKRPGRDGRTRYDFAIDLPGGIEYCGDDLQSGVGGGGLQEGMESLLSFLAAVAESYDYRQRTGRRSENEDLFAPYIAAWASRNEAELSMLQCQIADTVNLIEE